MEVQYSPITIFVIVLICYLVFNKPTSKGLSFRIRKCRKKII